MLQTEETKTSTTTKVLVVEDEGEIGLLLNLVLIDRPIDLEYVNSLTAAKEHLEKNQPSVIMLDNRLPDGYGVDFIPYIKQNYPGTHVMMVSGYSSAQDLAMENGADVFIEKPFSGDTIRAAFDKIIR